MFIILHDNFKMVSVGTMKAYSYVPNKPGTLNNQEGRKNSMRYNKQGVLE